MDSQTPKMPELSVEPKREEEKKRSGLPFFNLFGKGAGGFSGAFGGAGVGGGLLATKAGLVAMILVGSTLAGGIGVVGYKAFGPGASQGDGRFSSIFAQKSKEQIAAEEAAAKAADAAANGQSASLSDFAKANSGAFGQPEQPGAADAAKPEDKTAKDAAAIAAASAAAKKGADNNTNVGGNKAASLKTDQKFGQLSKLGGAGGAGGGSSASFSTAGPGSHAKLSGFSGGPSANLVKAGGQGSRAKKFGAFGQALAANRDGLGNKTSMQGAGATFDGNGAAAPIGGDKGLAMGGAGEQGGGDTNKAPSSSPGVGTNDNRFAQPPAAQGTNVTPWQAAINTAAMLVAAAAVLLYAIGMCSKLGSPWGKIVAYALAGIAAAIGAYVVYLGSLIGGNFYGQHLQGQMFELAGTFVIASAAAAATNMEQTMKDPMGNTLLLMCGVVALGATAVAYLTPARSVDSSFFKNGYPPDYDYHATDKYGRKN